MDFENREYQNRAIEQARKAMARGIKRFIFQAPTGAGKTALAGMVAKMIVAKGGKLIMAAHRRELVLQPRDKFIWMGIPEADIGVMKAGEESLRNPLAPIQIVSINTVHMKALPPADVLIVDECHRAGATMYRWLIQQYPKAYVIGLTATPTRLDNKPLSDIFDEIIIVAQPSELVAGGFIVAPRVFTAPDSELPNLDGVHHVAGDFNEKELADRVMTRAVIGSIPEHWFKHARGLRTMLSAVTIKHSLAVVDVLNAAGIRAKHIDGKAKKKDRDAALAELRNGSIDVLCQVGLWIEGLDMPELKCWIMARPTESLVIHLQSCGRIMRPWNDVQPILLDHAGNCLRLGLPTRDRDYSLTKETKDRGEKRSDPLAKRCKNCNETVDAEARICPVCGAPFGMDRDVRQIEDVQLVEMKEITSKPVAPKKPTPQVMQAAFDRFWQMAYRDGHDESWVIRRFAEKYGDAPPADWKPPERPVVFYTLEEKRKESNRLTFVAQRQGFPFSWVEQRYQAKFNEPHSALESQAREIAKETVAVVKAAIAPEQEKIDLEF